MTGEVWAVVGVGVTLFVAILGQGYYLGGHIDALAGGIRALGERLAKLEGLFEGARLPWAKEDPKR